MVTMTRSEVLGRRLVVQGLAPPGVQGRAADVVRLLTCVQSQESAHAFWSLGMRTSGLTMADVRAEFDAGHFVRTHILRPTWHFVAAQDLRWIQAVTAPRVHQLNGTVRRQYDLDERAIERSTAAIVGELTGGNHLTRAELGRLLGTTGTQLAYQVMHAELEALICSGPMRGVQHTYALVAERIPESVHAQGDVAELARRFFVGHGPATVANFARWSSLTKGQSTAAVEQVSDQLESAAVDGHVVWFDPTGPPPVGTELAALLPLYDEATLTYRQITFPTAPGHPHRPGEDLFVGSVISERTNVGNWRRTVRGRTVSVELPLAAGLSPGRIRGVETAAAELAAFLGLDLALVPAAAVDRVR